jgi:RNA polymerase sigma-70 factor (ECF subfamily)
MRPSRLLRTDATRRTAERETEMPTTSAHRVDPAAPPGQDMPLPRQRPRLATEPSATEPSPPDPAAPHPLPTDEAAVDAPAQPGADSTWHLVQAAQGGDMGAFEQLFERYYDVVFRFVLFRTNDRPLAEDITSETFVRALRRIGSVSYQGRDIVAWFITIARNLIFDHVKSSRYRLESTQADMVDLSPSTHGPEQQVLDGATHDELLRCVAKLNPDQQECIHLRFLQGLSVAETARIMDRNEGAVKALQHRAVRRLAQLLPDGLR